jgi:hypothetical protein
LADGRVAIFGGSRVSDFQITRAAEIYDPATGLFQPLANAREIRIWHSASLLPDGRVLIAGGWGTNPLYVGTVVLNITEIYNPATNTYAVGPMMRSTRQEHAATVLPGGAVLLAGGNDDFAVTNGSAEIYSPATNSFTITGSMTLARRNSTLVNLSAGRALVVGGRDDNGMSAWADVFKLDRLMSNGFQSP